MYPKPNALLPQGQTHCGHTTAVEENVKALIYSGVHAKISSIFLSMERTQRKEETTMASKCRLPKCRTSKFAIKSQKS